ERGGGGMDESRRPRRHLAAQMDRGQIKASERSDDQKQQGSQRGARYAARHGRIDEKKQAKCAQRRMQQRQWPRRELSLQNVDSGKHQPSEGGNGEDDDSIDKHASPPLWSRRQCKDP